MTTIAPQGDELRVELGRAEPLAGPVVVFVASDSMGRGDEELGRLLFRSFFHTLVEVRPRPDRIIFINTGVRLVCRGSEVLDDLRALAAAGADILACGTCLGYFELKDSVAVGRVSNMYEIAESLLGAGQTVYL